MQRAIRCTPENLPQMRQVVAQWPQLRDLVEHLRRQNLFPGLRGLQITLSGDESWCAKGLGALTTKNAPESQKTELTGHVGDQTQTNPAQTGTNPAQSAGGVHKAGAQA